MDNDEVLQSVTFRLENESYGVNVMQVQEVLRDTWIAPVTCDPSYVLGITNLKYYAQPETCKLNAKFFHMWRISYYLWGTTNKVNITEHQLALMISNY